MLAVVIRVFLSWIRPNPFNPFVKFIYNITEPVLQPIRRVIPPIGGTLDISPIILFLIITIIIRFLS